MTASWLTDTVTGNLDRALHYTLLWGFEGVELRTVGGSSERVPHVNEERLVRRLRETELVPVAISPGMFEGEVAARVTWLNELAAFGETLGFCRRIGCPVVVVSAVRDGSEEGRDGVIDALRQAGRQAARAGVTIAVLNETDGGFPRGEALGALLAEVDHPSVGAAWAPAEALQAGEDPADGLEAIVERVAHVRLRGIRREGDAWTATRMEEGEIDVEAHLRRLHKAGYKGAVSAEILAGPKPKTGLYDAAFLVRTIRTSAR
jgi:sugar phosphate isomerase/epimerase